MLIAAEPPATAPGLHITVLGAMSARAVGRVIAPPPSLPANRKTRALLAILLVEGPDPVLRDWLCGLLWPGRAPMQARASLRQALHELTAALRPFGIAPLSPARDEVALDRTALRCDVWDVRHATALNPDAVASVASGLVPELRGLGPAFEAWRPVAQARLAQHARVTAETALALAETAQARAEIGRLLLRLDPIHRAGAQTGEARPDAREPRRWSVRVGAFEALGATPADQATILRGALAAALPRLRWLGVFAPGIDARPDHGPTPDGAAFVIEGTVQQAGPALRAVIRLRDTERNDIVWAETFDDATASDRVADAVCARAEPAMLLRAGERARARLDAAADGPAVLRAGTARDLVLAAVPATYRLTHDQFAHAGALLSAAIGRDPDDAVAHAWAAYWHVLEAGQGWAADPALSIRRAGALAERAVGLDPLDARALAIAGHVRAFLHRSVDEALALHTHALSRNPALPLAWTLAGLALAYAGRHDEAVAHVQRARALAPRDPHGFFTDMALMVPLLAMGRDEEVVGHARAAATLNPALSSTHKGWLSALGHLRRRSEQATVLGRLLLIEPGFSLARAAARSPYTRPADRDRYLNGLRAAGLPE